MNQENKSIRQDRIFSPYFIALFFISLLVSSVTYLGNTTMVSYSTGVLGTTLSLAGTIAGATNLGSLVITFFCGPLNNRVSKKRLIQLASLLFAAATFGYAVSKSVPAIIFFRLIAGFANGINFTSAMVYVTMILPEDRITEGTGYYGLANTVMQSFGPMLALLLIGNFGFAVNFSAAGIMAIAGFALTLFLPDTPLPDRKREKTTLSKLIGEVVCKEAWLPATVGFLFALINGMQQALMVSYANSLGLGGYSGTYFLVVSAMMIVSRIALGRFIQSRTVSFAVCFSGAFLLASTVLLASASGAAGLLLGGGLFGVGYGTLLPVTQSLSVKLAPAGKKGSGSSTYYMGVTCAFFLAPVVGTLIADPGKLNLGYRYAFLVLALPCLAAIAIALKKGRMPIN